MDKEIIITTNRNDFPDDVHVKSIYPDQLLELAEVYSPEVQENQLEELANTLASRIEPTYVFFSWRNTAVLMLPEEQFIELKTNRNQLLITKEEQAQLYDIKVSIAGMSVGSSILYGLAGSTIANNIAIADDDEFLTSNLNRVQAGVLDIQESKAITTSRRALEMNPFLNLRVFNERITDENISEFLFNGDGDVIFEEIDDFRMKLRLREEAKKFAIPLVMLTNLGDSVMVDIERYDNQPETEYFNGLVDSSLLTKIMDTENIDQEMMKELSIALVDNDLVSDRAKKSLKEIGHTLVGRPQLYNTVALDGGIAPYIVRRIKLNDINSGRYRLRLDSLTS